MNMIGQCPTTVINPASLEIRFTVAIYNRPFILSPEAQVITQQPNTSSKLLSRV